MECDVLIVGGGAAGMSAALAARLEGLSVIVAEKYHQVGGSTAQELPAPGSHRCENNSAPADRPIVRPPKNVGAL